MRAATLIALAALCFAHPVHAEDSGAAGVASSETGPYGRISRVSEIAAALAALRAMSDGKLLNTYRYVQLIERSQCRAPLLSLKVDCLLEAARRSCRSTQAEARKMCERASDIMITNRLGANVLIPQEERLDLMKTKGQSTFREVFEKELRTRYASLVVEMAMAVPPAGLKGDALAATIDTYCRRISGRREISWQHCASAIVWFVATSDRQDVPGKEKR